AKHIPCLTEVVLGIDDVPPPPLALPRGGMDPCLQGDRVAGNDQRSRVTEGDAAVHAIETQGVPVAGVWTADAHLAGRRCAGAGGPARAPPMPTREGVRAGGPFAAQGTCARDHVLAGWVVV